MSRFSPSTNSRQLLLTALVVSLFVSVASAQISPPGLGPVQLPGGVKVTQTPGGGNQGKIPPKVVRMKDTPRTVTGLSPRPNPGLIPDIGLLTPGPNSPTPPPPPKGGSGKGGKGGSLPGGPGHPGTDVGAIIGGGLNLLGSLLSQPPDYRIHQPDPVDPRFIGPLSARELVAEIKRTELDLASTYRDMSVLQMQSDFARRASELGAVHPQHRAQARQQLKYQYQGWLQGQPSSSAFASSGFASYWQQLQDPDLARDQHRLVLSRLRAARERARSLEDHLDRLYWRLRRQ